MKKRVLLAVFLGASVAVFAQTNMTLEGVQTNTGAKTFLNGSLLFRNAANTFSGSFTNAITANRTYTLPNASGTIALTSNLTWASIASKPTTIGGYGITDFNSLGDARWLRLSGGTNTFTGVTNLYSGGNNLTIGNAVGSTLAFSGTGFILSNINDPMIDYSEVQVSSTTGIFRWISNANNTNQGVYNRPLATYLSFGSSPSSMPEVNGTNSFIKVAAGGITINDGINSRGLVNADNYFANYTDRTIPDWGNVKANLLGLPLSAPTVTEAGKSVRWNAAGTAWEYFTPGGGGTFTGTSGQIPFANLTSDAHSYTSQFTYDAANAVLRVGQGSPTINGTPNNTYILGETATINAAITGGGTVTDAIIGGELNTVGDGINFFSGSVGLTYGKSNFNFGVASLVGGYSARTLQGGQPAGSLYAQGSVAIGISEYSGSISPEPVTANAGAINISANTTAQVVGHGAYGNLSAIIGGRNHNVPLTSQRSAILGGDGIKARPNEPDQVYVPNFNIVASPAIDNTLTQVIVRDGTTGQIKYRDANTIGVWTTSGATINYTAGDVGIGTSLASNPNGYKLAVNGKIGAKDVQVETSSSTWPDYVFNATYQLPSLQSVEKFIKVNNHLENVPSAEEVERNGHSLGEMDKILLKKVEELTLYIIQQQKEIEALKKLVEKK